MTVRIRRQQLTRKVSIGHGVLVSLGFIVVPFTKVQEPLAPTSRWRFVGHNVGGVHTPLELADERFMSDYPRNHWSPFPRAPVV